MTVTSPPVTWDGLALNPLAPRSDGVLPVVEDVTGWYDTPDYAGNDTAWVLADGSATGPKTANARTVVVSGTVVGPAAALATFRDLLVVRAAGRYAADLSITDAAGRPMTAHVRCDSDGLKHSFLSPDAFTYQATMTANDPRLYGTQVTKVLTNFSGGQTGWIYGQAASAKVSSAIAPASPWTEQLATFAATAVPPSFYFFGYANTNRQTSITITANLGAELITAGDTGIVYFYLSGTSAVTVTDTQGNVWTELPEASQAGTDVHVFYCSNHTGLSATDTVTVTLASGAGILAEFVTVAALKGYGAYIGASAANGNGAVASATAQLQTPQTVALCALSSVGGTPALPAGFQTWHGIALVGGFNGLVCGGPLGRPGSRWKSTVACAPSGGTQPWAMGLLGFEAGSAVSSYEFAYQHAGPAYTAALPCTYQAAALTAGDTGMLQVITDVTARVTATDTKGNSWVSVVEQSAPMPSAALHVLICPNARALTSTDVITVTSSQSAYIWAQAFGVKGLGRYISPVQSSGNSTTPTAAIHLPVQAATVIALTGTNGGVGLPPGYTQITNNQINMGPMVLTSMAAWISQSAPATWPDTTDVRLYQRLYAATVLPNQAILANAGNVGAPVTALYSGDLGPSRLVDNATGDTIYLAAIASGAQITLDTETLTAYAQGGASRASYILPGSVPLLIPPLSSASWSLYATGSGSVTLSWKPAWH